MADNEDKNLNDNNRPGIRYEQIGPKLRINLTPGQAIVILIIFLFFVYQWTNSQPGVATQWFLEIVSLFRGDAPKANTSIAPQAQGHPTESPTQGHTPAPDLLHVPAGLYEVPANLQDWLGREPVRLDTGFYLQPHEVTVAEFQHFLHSPLTDRRLELSDWNRWGEDGPVTNIDWTTASQYATWFKTKTKTRQAWRLPDRRDWKAAILFLREDPASATLNTWEPPEPAASGQRPQRHTEDATAQLLGNVREWSREPCRLPSGGNGHYILGKSFRSDPSNNDLAAILCSESPADSTGFRLLREE